MMLLLSDAQAESVCGGGRAPAGTTTATPAAGLAAARKGGTSALCGCARPVFVINLLINPLINVAVAFASNGGIAIVGNQSNSLTTTLG